MALGFGTAWAAIAAAVWVGTALDVLRGGRVIRGLRSVEPLRDEALPSLTIVSTARNEAPRVEHAVRSLLAQDYPGVEIILVDDRSTDATGAILDAMAAHDPRVRVLHVSELPPGWVGKCHALACGAGAARGEWLLFTDGDVWMEPSAVRRAVSLARDLAADHLAVGADIVMKSPGERVFVGYFSVLFYASQRPWRAPDPRSTAHIGIGAFNLVRREAYDRSGGHGRLRMEILDDLGLGLVVKRAGGRSCFALHDGFIRVRWHEGVRGLIRGVEKNAFAALRFRVVRTILSVAAQLAGSWAPVACLFLPGWAPKVLAGAAWAGVFVLYRVISRNVALGRWDFLTMPLGAVLFAYAVTRSMIVTLRRGGVVWRGTHYALRDLERGLVR